MISNPTRSQEMRTFSPSSASPPTTPIANPSSSLLRPSTSSSSSPSSNSDSKAEEERDKGGGREIEGDYDGGCCHPERLGLCWWSEYQVHIPETISIVPHSEGGLMWDSFFHHRGDVEGGTPPLPPLKIRIIVLLLLFLVVVGPCLGFASVGALSSQLRTELGFSEAQMGFLFAAYSLPNLIAVFAAGILVDKIGCNSSLLICVVMFILGNFIVLQKSYFAMVIGRILYGMGSECVAIVQSTLIARWYSHDPVLKLSTANAFCMESFRVGALISMFFLPWLAETYDLDTSLRIVFLASAASGFLSIFLLIIDRKYDEYLRASLKSGEFHWSSILSMPKSFWMIVFCAMTFYGGAVPIISFLNAFLEDKWHMAPLEASSTSSIYYFVATICLVPLGMAVDKYGHRATGAIISVLLPIIGLALLGLTSLSPIVGIVLIGFAYSSFPGILWPSIPLIVDSTVLGTAFGLVGCSLNVGLFLSPIILGALKEKLEWTSYEPSVLVLMGFCILALFFAILLWVFDYRSGQQLEFTVVLKLPTASILSSPDGKGRSSFIVGGKRRSAMFSKPRISQPPLA